MYGKFPELSVDFRFLNPGFPTGCASRQDVLGDHFVLPPSTVTCYIRLSEAHKRACQSDILTSEHTYKGEILGRFRVLINFLVNLSERSFT